VLEDGQKMMVGRLETAAGSVSKTASAHVIHGSAGQAIVDYAEAHGADCIIVHSHKPELSDYLLGSTAARVVRHAPCSVHVIR
jgi:nucleotide-binding universal stress UspA family protein